MIFCKFCYYHEFCLNESHKPIILLATQSDNYETNHTIDCCRRKQGRQFFKSTMLKKKKITRHANLTNLTLTK